MRHLLRMLLSPPLIPLSSYKPLETHTHRVSHPRSMSRSQSRAMSLAPMDRETASRISARQFFFFGLLDEIDSLLPLVIHMWFLSQPRDRSPCVKLNRV